MVAGAVLLALFQLHNDDAFFHVATGRWILQHGHVPLHNPFTYANDGAVWLQHQWLPAVAIALIVDTWGIASLVAVKAAWVGVVFMVLAWHLDRGRLPIGTGAALLSVTVVASAFRFYERPFLCSALALAITATALLRWQRRGLVGRLLPSVALLTTAVAWQLHAGALHSVLAWCALLGGVTLAWVLAMRSDDTSAQEAARRALLLASGWFLAMVASSLLGLLLLAPGGLDVTTLPAHFSANAYWHTHLAEFRPLGTNASYGLQWLAVALAVAVAALAAWQRRWAALLLVAGFTLLAVRHQRMVWVMGIAIVASAGTLSLRPLIDAKLKGVIWQAGLLVASLLLLALGWMDQEKWFRPGLGADGLDHRRHPVELLREAAKLPGETFVSDGLAGTWLWLNYRDEDPDGRPLTGDQQHRVLIHNCLECYDEATYIDTYQAIRYGLPGWQKKVTDLGIRSFVLKYTTRGERRFQKGEPNVRQHLFQSPDWVLVDFDNVAAVYGHRDHLPAGMATLADFPVDPDTGRARSGANQAQVMAALLDHALARPQVHRSLDMARRRMGRMDAAPTNWTSLGQAGQHGVLVWEYWWRWHRNRYGWPAGVTSPYEDELRTYRASIPRTR